MKGFILTLKKTAYKNAYTLKFKTLFTPAKLVIPKKDGKPTLDGTWYVYFVLRSLKKSFFALHCVFSEYFLLFLH